MPFISNRPVVGFDLDMTLVDSAAGIAATLRAALADYGRTVTDEQVWPTIGISLEVAVAGIHPDLDADAVTRRYRELYPTTGIEPITVLPGATEAFRAVRAAGGRVLVVSAKIESAVRTVLAHVGLAGPEFGPDLVVGGLFGAAKGTVLAEQGAQVYVGDHPGDVEAARAGGATSVGVATGPHTAEQLRAAGADVVLADLRAFPAWFGQRFSDHVTEVSVPPRRGHRLPSGTLAGGEELPRSG